MKPTTAMPPPLRTTHQTTESTSDIHE